MMTLHMEVEEMLTKGAKAAVIFRMTRESLVSSALRMTNGNQCKAAAVLGVHRNTLTRWMSELRVKPFGPSTVHGVRPRERESA